MEKQLVVEQFGSNAKDTGSTSVQIAILSERINYLTGHLKKHSKDFSSRRGLMQIIGNRKRLLKYLKSEDVEKYKSLISELGIRK